MPFSHGLTPAYDSGFSSSGTATPVRESSASYPPLSSMQQQSSSAALQLQLQALQSQLQLQSSESLGAQQQRIVAHGSGSSLLTNGSNGQGVTVQGTPTVHVLLVSNEPSLSAIFHQALSQAPVSSILHMATGPDMWSVIEQIKAVTGRPQGPDIVFFQPDVLVANPGTASRVKQSCGASCAAVVLQASEPIARALQADDFLAGPSPIQPLRKEDLALVILKWRARQQGNSSSSTVSSVSSALGPLPSAAAASPATALSGSASLPKIIAAPPGGGLPNGSLPLAAQLGTPQKQSQQPQLAQLQHLQAQLALQLQARQQQQQRQATGAAASTALIPPSVANGTVTTGEIEPAAVGQQPAVYSLGTRSSPLNRPPPLRLASAGISPADALPEAARNLARASTPLPMGVVAGMGTGAGGTQSRPAADVQELMAQVTELRRKLGDKSQVASGRVATISSTGVPPPSVAAATSAGAGTGAGTSLASGMGMGMVGAGGGAAGGGKGGQQPPAAVGQLSQQLPGMPPAEVQVKLQELQQQQQALMQRLANANGTAGQRISASALPSPAVGTTAASNGTVTAARPLRKLGLENHGSLVRPVGVAAAAAALGGGGEGQTQSALLSANIQLQQQLLQLQQLQLQLQLQQQQQQRLVTSAGPAAASTPTVGSVGPGISPFAVDMPLATRAVSVSASGMLSSPHGSALPSPIGSSVPSPSSGNERSPAGADGSPVSRSNSFVAAGGTRYRPPRQRSPSPLGGAASGHLSDGYLGLGTSRLASSSLPHRSVSSSQVIPANVSGGGNGGGAGSGGSGGGGGGGSGGNGSGHNSDFFTSPEPSGSLPKLTKSGDDAIAAALSAAASDNGDGEFEGSSQPSTSVAASAEHNQRRLSEMLRNLDPDTGGGGAGGGSSVDGRSLMDASFALDDSGTGGRGSISGGVNSSIDLQPSPRPPSSSSSAKAAASAAAESPRLRSKSQSQLQPSPQGSHRSNLGATSVGSHRLASASLLPADTAEEDDEPLKVGPSRRPEQPSSKVIPTATATITPPQPAPRSADAGFTGEAGKNPAKAAATQDASQPLSMLTPPKLHPPSPEPAAPGGIPRTEQGGAGAAGGSATGGDSREASPVKLPLGLRVDSLDGDRLPSIDGTKPLAAAAPAAGGAAAAAGSNGEAGALHSTAESSVRPDAPIAVALSPGGVAVVAGSNKPPPAAAHLGDANSSPTTTASDATADSALMAPTLRSTASGGGPSGAGAVFVGTGSGRFSEGMSVVASIEGCIAAGLVQAPGVQKLGGPSAGARHPAPDMWRSGSGASSSRAQTSSNGPVLTAGTPAGSATGSAYTDDIFAMMRAAEREASSSPSLLLPPPRSSTPPARRAARILMCSHPIVITREDFL